MNIVVTGAGGFLGRNLVSRLRDLTDVAVAGLLRSDPCSTWEKQLGAADFVYHLAGENRPADPSGFRAGNVELTRFLVELLRKEGRCIPMVFASSTQVGLANDYGRSKREAEQLLQEYRQSGARVFIFRLPNVFGKWARPAYNSVVATFCHQIATDQPLSIYDASSELPLVYVDDVIEAFVQCLPPYSDKRDGVYDVHETTRMTVGKVAEMLLSFERERVLGKIPDFPTSFTRKLYATFMSYLPPRKLVRETMLRADQRGVLYETLKGDAFGQVFISTTKPGVTRGNHYHRAKVEKFCVIKGEAEIVLKSIATGEEICYRVSGVKPCVVDIPPGSAHCIQNTGVEDIITLFWTSQVFDEKQPDTFCHKVRP